MEALGRFIFWMIKIFLLLFGFVLLLGGGFCVVMPLFERTGGFGAVSAIIGAVGLLIGWLVFSAALRMIWRRDAEPGSKDTE